MRILRRKLSFINNLRAPRPITIPATHSPAAPTIVPDGKSLSVDTIARIARDPTAQIELTPEICARVIASRRLLDDFVASGRIIYGVTTSVGGFVKRKSIHRTTIR